MADMYSIEIKRWVENPLYKDELKKWQADRKYSSYSDAYGDKPNQYIETKALSTMVTQEQFETIRKETLKVF